MNAPTTIEWSERRFGPETAHWMPRNAETALDHIPGDDGIPVLGTTLAQLKDPVGFTNRMVAQLSLIHI